ncbi:MAG: nucleotidyltransferase domain-containing protein [Rhodomicrobium sp.]
MSHTELNNEQRRELINMQQMFEAWRAADHEFRHSYKGRMRWKKVHGQEYLYRVHGKTEKSLGPKTPETEQIKKDYTDARTRLKRRATLLKNKIEGRAAINKALRLGLMPNIAAKILRKLDQVGLLGAHLIVVGTHSLYAYGARAGVIFGGELTATQDIDFMFDARRRLSLAIAPELNESGVIGLLRSIDPTFSNRPGHFRAVNDDGYYVDLIRPAGKDEISDDLGGLPDNDLVPVAIMGLEWLMNAPRFEEMVIADDGLPAWVSCIDPRVYALYKYWLATKVQDRSPLKKNRDKSQAMEVARVARNYLNMPFDAKALTALPMDMVKVAKKLA